MDWREATVDDVVECLKIEPRVWGDEIAGRKAAEKAWSTMVWSLASNSAVIETLGPRKKMVGFGFSLFVTREFADAELANPEPGMNSRIVASLSNERPAMLSEARLCETDEPLDLAIMGGNLRYELLNAEETVHAEMILTTAFAEMHLGYRLNRILLETLTEKHRHIIDSSGVWRRVAEYPDTRALFVLTREEAFSVSGSVAGPLFDYREPVLRLRQPEKRLLAAALRGGTDKELAEKLNLSLPTVKKRWASVFDRVAEARPDLLPDEGPRESQENRGPQKRHRILAYVHAHPEEVRPYRWRMGLA